MLQQNAHVNGNMSSSTAQEPPLPPLPSELDKLRETLGGGFQKLVGLIKAIRSPLPDQTDGGAPLSPEEEAFWLKKVQSDLGDLGHLGIKDIESLIEVAVHAKFKEPIDDKDYIMEALIKAAAGLPTNSMKGKKITDTFLTTLWNDLQHPPQSLLGDEHAFRSADGANNSLVHPMLGAAGMPYARTCTPKTMQPGTLPDPGVIFDAVMARKDKNREPHPNRISSVLFYLASIIIHDLFRTDHDDYNISQTSSYLDLSPLYGSNQAEQDTVRTKKDGKLHPDTFAEKRLLGFPPGVSVLLVMFNRFHNSVVDNLARINEGGRFNLPREDDPIYKSPRYKDKRSYESDMIKYDEELFQTGRLITCGLYINIVLIDYVRTILNLNRTDSKWQLNPRAEIDGVPRGTGNQVAAEFNLVYRWHSAISARDEKWTEQLWKRLFPDVEDPNTIGEMQLLRKLAEEEARIGDDPTKWSIGDLERDPHTGRFSDEQLVEIITSSIEDPANSFGANRVPVVMRSIEILGMKQARKWNVATLNEFRQYFGLERHREFTDINPDPEVADQLRHLYGHPDLVEMYPGLVAESAKKPIAPGSGLCPSFTVSRAVLSDAVALVRGDRFYTIDYHPKRLTNWGYSLVNFDLDIDNGCVFYKLFTRAFPQWFEPNSIYAHYPLTVPKWQREALVRLGTAHLYDYSAPKFKAEPVMIFSYAAAEKVLGDKATFTVTWGKAIEFLMGDPAKNFMLSGDGYENEQSRKLMARSLYNVDGWRSEIKRFYEKTTLDLLREKSYKLAGVNQVDIIRDVGNLAHVRFCAELFMMPVKGKDRPGVFNEYELYMIMAAVFCCVFFDLDPVSSFPLRQKAHQATQLLGKLVEANVKEIKYGGILSALMQLIWPRETSLQLYGKRLIERLLAASKDEDIDVHNLVWGHIMGTAGGMVPNQGQLLAQTLEYFFSPEGSQHLPEINRLAKSNDPRDFDTLMKYFLEGSRLYGETGVFRAVTRPVTVHDGQKTINLRPGDTVMVNLRAASHDDAKFPNPTKLDLNRPIESYIHLGAGPHKCLGWDMTRVALTTMLKVIGSLDGLRPAKGPQGFVQKITQPFPEGTEVPGKFREQDASYHAYLTEKFDSLFPFPTGMKINWDGNLP